MGLHGRPAHDVHDRDPAHGQRIGDERTVAAPGHGFGAHDRGLSLAGRLHQLEQPFLEIRCLHIIREPPEGRVLPSRVQGVFLRVAKAAEGRHVEIIDSRGLQAFRQRLAVELGIMPRLRDGAYIDHLLDAVGPEHCQEPVEGMGGMADGVDRYLFHDVLEIIAIINIFSTRADICREDTMSTESVNPELKIQ